MAFVVGEVSAPVTADSAQFERVMGDVKKQGEQAAKSIGEKFQQLGRSMDKIGKNMTKCVTLPLVAVGVAAFKLGKDFEVSMSQIVGLVGVAQNQVDQWGRDILQMAPDLGKAPKELADALFFVTSAGIRGAEAMDVLEMSAKASAAGLGETKVVADLVTSAMNAYGVENLNATQATDILVAAVREGKAEASELAASMGSVLPIAAEMGVSFDQVAAAQASMTRTGTSAAEAATQVRAIMVGLLKPSKQAEEALDMMGTSSKELREQIREKGLIHVLGNLRELTNTYGEEVMAQVFPNIRALAGVLDLMGSNAEDNIATFEALEDSTGALEHAFEAASETVEFKWQQALSQAQVVGIELWETLKESVIPVLQKVTETIKNTTEWFRNLESEQKENIVKWALIAAAIGPVLLVGAKLIGFISTLAPLLVVLKIAFIALAGFIGSITLPITLVIAAVAALFLAWRTNLFGIRDVTESVVSKIKDFFGIGRKTIVEEVEAMSNESVASVVGMSQEIVRELINLSAQGESVSEEMAEKLIGNVNNMKDEAIEAIRKQTEQNIEDLTFLRDEAGVLSDEMCQELVEDAEKTRDQKIKAYEDMAGEIEKKLTDLRDSGVEITSEIRAEIVKEVQGMTAAVVTVMSDQEVEVKAILAKLRNESGDITREMAADVISNSAYQRDEAIAQAEEMYDETIKAIIRQRDEVGILSAEQADELIKQANRQKTESVDEAKALHYLTVHELEQMGIESINTIDTDTGEMLSGWQVFGRDFVKGTNTWIADVGKSIRNWTEEMDRKIEKFKETAKEGFNELWAYIKSIPDLAKKWGRDIMDKFWGGLKEKYYSAKAWVDEKIGSLMNKFNPWSKSSPSLVEKVRTGLGTIMDEFKNLDYMLEVKPLIERMGRPAILQSQPVTAGAGVSAVAGAGPTIYNGPLVMIQNMIVRSDSDIAIISRQLHRHIQASTRARGGG